MWKSGSRFRLHTAATLVLIAGAIALPIAVSSARAVQVVNVRSEGELQRALGQLRSGTTIVLAPGVYRLTRTLFINGTFTDVGLRGASGNRDDVILQGSGMAAANGAVPYGIWVGGDVRGVTIADLTIRDVAEHSIVFDGGTERPTVSNVRLLDAGKQLLKSNPSRDGGVDNGVVEKSVIEYSTTAPSAYTNGVDVHTGANWVIRDNVFRNIAGPPGTMAGPAVLVWNRSSNTVTERNRFLNCTRSISYGLIEREGGRDHRGGVVRNNMIFRSRTQPGDVGIMVADSPDTQVLNNTVFLSGTYATPIEYRFAGSSNVIIVNNLVDGTIAARDGATAVERTSLQRVPGTLFVDAGAGDLHLSPQAAAAIDKGTALGAVADDWDGDRRPSGPAPDIGADEYRAPGLSGNTELKKGFLTQE